MIYTVTLNPSIDYVIKMDGFCIGRTNRSVSEECYLGGKGINVSLVLKELGIRSTAIGFLSGFTGEEIEKRLLQNGIDTDFVKLGQGISRINIKIEGKDETEINGTGPGISREDTEKFLKKVQNVKSGDILIMSGSVPPSLTENIYEDIIRSLNGKNILFAVDTSGRRLLSILKYGPFLIKPNLQELCEIFEENIESEEDIFLYGERLKKMGAVNVLISLGSKGALLIDEHNSRHRIEALKCKAVNTVGAGDSMVAGFLAGYSKTGSYEYSLKLGQICSAATVILPHLATREKISELFESTHGQNFRGFFEDSALG